VTSLNYELSIQGISFSFIAHYVYKSLMLRSCDWHLWILIVVNHYYQETFLRRARTDGFVITI